MAKQLSLVGGDANVEVGHQDENSLASIGTAYAGVVQLAAVAQRDRSPAVDVVAAHSRFSEHRLSTDLNRGPVECTPRAHGGTVARLVWSRLVVIEHEAVNAP